ncbi:MAG: SPASM domain-containing protein, partial [Spirochaetales bacterium]|nr:SPASM domain-containing protein [Spirochaetales bacterium]
NAYPDMLLTKDDYIRLFEFIRNKRIANENVTYGCGHYLGDEYEGELRDWFYMCIAGIQVASIASNGDILACLDIERRPELLQGNIKTDRFSDVWKNRFAFYRQDLGQKCAECQNCESYK